MCKCDTQLGHAQRVGPNVLLLCFWLSQQAWLPAWQPSGHEAVAHNIPGCMARGSAVAHHAMWRNVEQSRHNCTYCTAAPPQAACVLYNDSQGH